MATERWIAGSGVGLTWTSCFGTEVNSVVTGNAIQSSITISNATALDLLCDLSISLGSVTTGSGLPYVGFYFYPLNQDASTYGDGRFGSSAAGPPPTAYYAGAIPAPASTTAVVVGMIRSVWLPPGSGRFVLYNNLGVTLASSSNTIAYRTYNLQVL
jgi:hypothetical protein